MALLQNKSSFDTNGDTDDFNAANATTNLFNCKAKITGQTGHNGTKNAEKMVPLKQLKNFLRTLKMLLINCSKKCVIVATAVANQGATFSTTDTKVYTTVLTL